MDLTLFFKSLHIIFIVTWFAGLFYIVRLFIYHTEAQEKPEVERDILVNQFKIMERRLWYGITWPSAIIVALMGFAQLHYFLPLSDHPWLLAKLFFVVFLYLYHFACGKLLKEIQNDQYRLSSMQLRLWNEVATIFLFAIIFLVIFKDIMSMGLGIISLIGFSILLMIGIKFYKKKREMAS